VDFFVSFAWLLKVIIRCNTVNVYGRRRTWIRIHMCICRQFTEIYTPAHLPMWSQMIVCAVNPWDRLSSPHLKQLRHKLMQRRTHCMYNPFCPAINMHTAICYMTCRSTRRKTFSLWYKSKLASYLFLLFHMLYWYCWDVDSWRSLVEFPWQFLRSPQSTGN